MTILPIVVAPDPLLKMKSAPVEKITPEIKQLLDDMLETMYASNGVGLSAVQVGVLKRVIVVDTEWESPRYRTEGEERTDEKPKPGKPMKMMNPEIVQESEEDRVYNEGCLSFPGQYSEVKRPDTIRVKYLDENGKEHQIEAGGLLSTCIQHEIDHMDGIVFVDHISSLKRDMIMSKMKTATRAES